MRRQFERNGRVISYLVVEPPSGPPAPNLLVLLHAFPLSAEMWHPQLAAAPAGWRVAAPDVAGFGRSFPLPASATFEDDAGDVVALLDHLQHETAVVCGLSMGGYIAMALARSAASRLRALVLANTRPDPDSDEARRSRQEMVGTLERGGPAAVVDGMLPRLLGPTTREKRPAVVQRVRAIAVAQPADGVRSAIHRLMGRADSAAVLSALRCPALVVAGAEDAITGPDVARRMHEMIPGSELALIEAAGHLSSLERPAAFNDLLFAFLRSLPG